VETDKRAVEIFGVVVICDLLNDFDTVEFVTVDSSGPSDSPLMTVTGISSSSS
jgi:hypothetical protein